MRELVLLTGTSSGLGRATAARLLGAGYRVVGVSRRPVDGAVFGDDGAHYAHVCQDLSDTDAIAGMVRAVVTEHGVPWGLVNNAASGSDGLLATMHNSDIERAALELTEAVTRIADTPGDAVSDALWDEVADHFDEKQLSAIILTIAMTNFFNRINATVKEPAGTSWA